MRGRRVDHYRPALRRRCFIDLFPGSTTGSTVGLFKYFQTGVTYIATPFIAVLLMGAFFWKRAKVMVAAIAQI